MRVEKICTKIKEDGYRCGKTFYAERSSLWKNYCEECRYQAESKKSNASLVKSRNEYAKVGNDMKMRDFIIDLMARHEDDKKTIAKLEEVVESLSNRLTLLENNSEHLKLTKDVNRLERQYSINKGKIQSLRKLVHKLKLGE